MLAINTHIHSQFAQRSLIRSQEDSGVLAQANSIPQAALSLLR